MPVAVEEIGTNVLIQSHRTLLKVSNVYDTYFTAEVLLENGQLPPRTTVRSYQIEELANMREPSDRTVERYERLMGWRT